MAHKLNEKVYREFRDEDESENGVVHSDEELHYESIEDPEEITELQQQMRDIDADLHELTNETPVSLFSLPHLRHNFNNIDALKKEAEDDKFPSYVDDFEYSTRDDVLMVGKISLSQIQEEEKRLREEHLAYEQQELARIRALEQELLTTEEEAKRRVAQNLKQKRRKMARRIEIVKQKERLQLDMVHKAFRRSENHLTTKLTRKGADIKTMYGDLNLADGEYGGAKGRRWKLDWIHTPRPIQIKFKSLRGVKDKLPSGRYVVMASIYNRLSGSVLRWSKLKGQQWGGATLPVIHNGNFFNFEMLINQSVFVVLPPPSSLTPSMVLVFELFLLRGSVVQTDKVVSWGCFPLCRSDMSLIQGKYKTCFLRGGMDSRIDKFTKIEQLIASDLDHWMCNLYFEVIQLPRYMAGQKEFEVELQFSKDTIIYPSLSTKTKLGKELEHTDEPYQPVSRHSSTTNQSEGMKLTGNSGSLEKREGLMAAEEMMPRSDSPTEILKLEEGVTMKHSGDVVFDDSSSGTFPAESHGDPTVNQLRDTMSAEFRKRPMTTIGSRYAKREHRVHLDDSSSSESELDEEQLEELRKEGNDDVRLVRGEPGLTYLRYLNEADDELSKKVYTMLPQTFILKKRQQGRKLSYVEKLREYTPSVLNPDEKMLSETRKQLHYLRKQLLLELGLSNFLNREFWALLMIFVITFFLRIYIHYIGQWLLLTTQHVPINDFILLPYTVKLIYQNSLLHTVEEVSVVMIGPLAVFFIYLLGVILTAASIRFLQNFPDIGHKFVLCMGVQALLDPLFILIVDIPTQNYNEALVNDATTTLSLADFSKLYWHFMRMEGTGLGGILITVVIYAFTSFISGSVIYMHILRLFNNGRMLDIYWRLNSQTDKIFFPGDLEVSLPELDMVLKKSEQWRGEEGERRKISVFEYVWTREDLDDPSAEILEEKTTHISIHIVHLDGLKELYRHFLISPDGAIVEVFGETSPLVEFERNTKTSISSRSNLPGSQAHLPKVRGRQTVMTRAGFRVNTTASGSHSFPPTRESSSLSSQDDFKKNE